MKTEIFLVVFVVMSVFGNTIYAQTACPGWKNPLNFPMNPNYSGQTGSRPDGTSTYQQMYMTMTSAVIPAPAAFLFCSPLYPWPLYRI